MAVNGGLMEMSHSHLCSLKPTARTRRRGRIAEIEHLQERGALAKSRSVWTSRPAAASVPPDPGLAASAAALKPTKPHGGKCSRRSSQIVVNTQKAWRVRGGFRKQPPGKAAQRLLKPHRVSTNPLATACAGPQRTPQASGPGGAPELARGAPRPLPGVLWLPSPQGKRLRGPCRRHTFSFLLFSLPTHFVVLRGLQAADGIAFRPLGLPMVVPHRPPRQVGLAAISHSQADSMLSTFLRLCLLLSLPLLDPPDG